MEAFGEGERALRLVPLLAGLAALWLFYDLARRWLPATAAGFAFALLAQLRALPKGARVWLLYAHHPTWRTDRDEAFVVHVLDGLGERREVKNAPGASLHLYRLGG